MFVANSFNSAYKTLLLRLKTQGERSTNRKGHNLIELFDEQFMIKYPMDCFATCRKPSLKYLEDEFNFYLSGSNSLKDAIACSKFWEKCSDDGKTINSNYGKLLFYDKNEKGVTQFEHAMNCLKNNIQSKKAVMTLYDSKHAYISNDNPCTMYLRIRIDNKSRLHLSAMMRSSDIYFGLPYDVPFFVFVQLAALEHLKPLYPQLTLGTYTHMANSLHQYERNTNELEQALKSSEGEDQLMLKFSSLYAKLIEKGLSIVNSLTAPKVEQIRSTGNPRFMDVAWRAAKDSSCLKKKVGACMTVVAHGTEHLVAWSHGGVNGPKCEKCAREDEDDKYFGDECPSVHAEMRCITFALQNNLDLRNARIYVTHGPCDACLKFCDLVGIKEVFYDKPYKTNYAHWPRITVSQLSGN